MVTISFFLVIIITVLSGLALISADDNRCDNDYGNFTSGSSYGDNRDKILLSLYADPTAIQGSYSGSLGNASDDDTVYVISYCRGDSTTQQCIDCLNATAVSLIQRGSAARTIRYSKKPILYGKYETDPEYLAYNTGNITMNLVRACPNHRKALSWGAVVDSYLACTIRYSDESFYGKYETDPRYLAYNTGNITMNQSEFNQVWLNLTRGVAAKAAKGSLQLKYASAENILPNSEIIFAMAQCSPDMSDIFCQSCLLESINDYQRCCTGKRGGTALKPSCIFRWEMYPFYTPSTPISPPPPSQSPITSPPSPTNTTQGSVNGNGNTGSNGSRKNTIIIVVVSIVAGAISVGLIMCIFVLLVKKKRKRNPKQEVEGVLIDEISDEESLHFDLETVKAATDNFSDKNKLGQGGFGTVYKGKLPNGREIAVKRLSMSSIQGQLEFKNEITLLVKLQHRNLVRLLGFCLEGIERLLIYEYVSNSSLDHFIFDPVKRTLLNWETRYKITTGTARGILYLHEDSRLRIIHRDLKASNILLDDGMIPKIADFGMAKLFTEDQTRADTSRIVGTYGYMAPEYIIHGNFSVKTDVFSFGVLVLEIVSGRSINSFNNRDNLEPENIESLISYAWKNWKEGTPSKIIDPTLLSSGSSISEMVRCIHIGLLCVEQNIGNRPTMASVVLMLNSHSLTLQIPSQPAFSYMEPDNSSKGHSWANSANRDLYQVSTNEFSNSRLHPR